MGPFPHDAPAAEISAENPMGTDGFEFVEYAHPEPEQLHALFKLMGYVPVARHKTKKITVYRQGDINYLVNEQRTTGHPWLCLRCRARAVRAVDGVSCGRCEAGLSTRAVAGC
jgi:4-hydroxyphenylpyruvate dioxygenase